MIEVAIGYLAAITSIAGLLLISAKKWHGYIFWLIGSPLWIYLGYIQQQWEVVITFTTFQASNIYGIWNWKIREMVRRE